MIDLSPELEELRREAVVSDRSVRLLSLRESRALFSIHPEIRIIYWAGTALLASGAALWLQRHHESIGAGPVASIVAIAAVICYVTAARPLVSEGALLTTRGEFLLFLGALLLSGDVAFIESRFDLLARWEWYLLGLAIAHATAAYLFRSTMLVGLALVAFAGAFGVERHDFVFFDGSTEGGCRLVAAGVAVVGLRLADRLAARGVPQAETRPFAPIYEHAAAHLCLTGMLTLAVYAGEALAVAVLVTAVIVCAAWGMKEGKTVFLVYAILYGVAGTDVLVMRLFDPEPTIFALWLLVSTPVAIGVLWRLHARRNAR